jgi:Flp pilus assembly protein TadG
MVRRARRRLIENEAGQTLVEFALASTIFFTTLLGILVLGLMAFRYNMMADLAQEGARWASVRGSGASSPVSGASTGDVQAYVAARAVGIPVTVSTTSASGTAPYSCTATSVNPSTLSQGARFCVTVASAFSPMTGLVPLRSLTLQSTVQMVMAR